MIRIIICALLAFLLVFPVIGSAESLINDDAEILTNEAEINEILGSLASGETQVIIRIDTIESTDDINALGRKRYKEIYNLDETGKPSFNMLFLYAKKEGSDRKPYILLVVNVDSCGLDTDAILERIREDDIKGMLDKGNYSDAFLNFAKAINETIGKILEKTHGGNVCPLPSPEVFDNQKDMSLYTDGTVFIVSDENWKDVMRSVSLTIWNRGNEKCQDIYAPDQEIKRHQCGYPLLIYHREGDDFDAGSITLFLEQSGAEKVLIVGDAPQQLVNLLEAVLFNANKKGLEQSFPNVQKIEPMDYVKFWKLYEHAVVVEDDYKKALLASVEASRLNAPLFIRDDEFDFNDIKGREVSCIGKVSGVACNHLHEPRDIQEIMVSEGSDKVILVNPDDINDNFCEKEEFGNIRRIYCHDSLAAPYLAAAKDEVIIYPPDDVLKKIRSWLREKFLTDNTLNQIKPWFQKTINSSEGLFSDYRDVKYLTVIAGYKAIDWGIKYKTKNHRLIKQGIKSFEREIVNFDQDSDEEIAFGRIGFITISDTSANIMRSVFYEKLHDILYKDEKPQIIFAVATRLDRNVEMFLPALAYDIRDEYDMDCYVKKEANTKGICTKGFPAYKEFRHKDIIVYAGHGTPKKWDYGWVTSLNYNEIPPLDLSLGIASACSTNGYTDSGLIPLIFKRKLFGPNFIRKGGIGYYGALSESVNHYDIQLSPTMIYAYKDVEKKFRVIEAKEQSISIGSIYKFIEEGESIGNTMKHVIENNIIDMNKNTYILLGDPTVRLKMPKRDIGYYPELFTIFLDAASFSGESFKLAMRDAAEKYKKMAEENELIADFAYYYMAMACRESGWEYCGSETHSMFYDLLDSKDPIIRRLATKELGYMMKGAQLYANAIGKLIDLLEDDDVAVRIAAADALENSNNESTIPALIEALNDKNMNVRAESIDALKYFKGETVVLAITGMLKDNKSEVRRRAADALGYMGETSSLPALIGMLNDEDAGVRAKAAEVLGAMGDGSVLSALQARLKIEKNSYVYTVIKDSISKLGGGA